MKQLPDKFQMRLSAAPGYTHTVKRNAHGDYEVNWARGYPDTVRGLPRKVWTEQEVQNALQDVWWVFVEDRPKQEEAKLPDEFYFTSGKVDTLYRAKKIANRYETFWQIGGRNYTGVGSTIEEVASFVNGGYWKILDKPVLTAEQQRQLKDFNEQVQQLNNSIKIQEQDIEHKRRLISNYIQRQQELMTKIKELEGVYD